MVRDAVVDDYWLERYKQIPDAIKSIVADSITDTINQKRWEKNSNNGEKVTLQVLQNREAMQYWQQEADLLRHYVNHECMRKNLEFKQEQHAEVSGISLEQTQSLPVVPTKLFETEAMIEAMRRNSLKSKNQKDHDDDDPEKGARVDFVIDSVNSKLCQQWNVGDYLEGGAMYDEACKSIQRMLDTEYDTNEFCAEVIVCKHYVATKDNTTEKEQTNGRVYVEGVWRDDKHKILTPTLKHVLSSIGDSAIAKTSLTKNRVTTIFDNVVTRKDILHVDIHSPEYMEWRTRHMISPKGMLYDTLTGKIHAADPSQHYWEYTDLAVEPMTDQEYEEPAVFVEFLKYIFGEEEEDGNDWKVVRDHLATALLPIKQRGHKPRAMMIVGTTNTYKSTLVEYVADLFSPDAIANLDIGVFGKDQFAKKSASDHIFCWNDESPAKVLENQDFLKHLITTRLGKARAMNTTEMKPVMRWPTYVWTSNSMFLLGYDSDADSLLQRLRITIPKERTKDEVQNWYGRPELEDLQTKRQVLTYLLRRGTELYLKPDGYEPHQEQSLELIRTRYNELTIGKLIKFMERFTTKSKPNEIQYGIQADWLCNKYSKITGIKTGTKRFVSLLIQADYDVEWRKTVDANDGVNHILAPDGEKHRNIICGVRYNTQINE